MNNSKIGVFDSGVGGLTVLQGLQEALPNESYIYIGDNKHSPYGEKTYEQLLEYTSQIVQYFINCGVKMVVFACNTTSCTVLEELQKKYTSIPLIGVTDATCQMVNSKKVNKVLIMATKATINSQAYQKRIGEDRTVGLACPNLVPLIENGESNDILNEELVRLLDSYKDECDSIVLGCTHYPIVSSNIAMLYPNIQLYSSSDAVIKEVKNYLDENQSHASISVKSIIYTTGNLQKFIESASSFFDFKNYDVQALELEVE